MMESIVVTQLPALEDNYIYLLRDEASGVRAALDPGEADPVLRELAGEKLDYVLCTHHHADHVGGAETLRAETGAKIVGFEGDAHRLPKLDVVVRDNSRFLLGESQSVVFHIPGHTLGHISFWFDSSKALFCGDTLFSMGCGRLFEGTPAQMWASLRRLRELPDGARVFCGHEYTEANAQFALSIDPSNEALVRRAARVTELRSKGRPTVPSTLVEERLTNPFLRADDPDLQRRMGLSGVSSEQSFAEIRRRKDNYKGL